MSKMRYFSNKFSKIAKRWELSASQRLTTFLYWWSEVAWFGQIVVFQTDYGEIELLNISVTSSQLCHRKTSPKKRPKNFPFWLLPIKISGYAIG